MGEEFLKDFAYYIAKEIKRQKDAEKEKEVKKHVNNRRMA